MLHILSSAILIIISLNIFCHPTSLPQCLNNQTCGDVNVSYPFSLKSRPECPSFSSFFELDCNMSFGHEQLYLGTVPIQLIEISTSSLIIDMTQWRANQSCAGGNGSYSYLDLAAFPGPYFISDDNEFGSFGCNILGTLLTANLVPSQENSSQVGYSDLLSGGCYVSCPDDLRNPKCGNRTCCVSPALPSGSIARTASYYVQAYDPSKGLIAANYCSASNYSTLFHPDYTDFDKESYHLKLRWALPSNQNTSGLIQSSENYACSDNSTITFVPQVPGYLCSCNTGFTGDGYSNGSRCKDVNECNFPQNYCTPTSTCHNSVGNYTCKCNSRFYVGDGRINGTGCKFSTRVRNALIISGVVLGFSLLMGGFYFLAIWWRDMTKRKYFVQNGGLQLQVYIKAGARETFSAEELKAATNNYSDEMKLGVGGFGTVYKGTLENGTVVAIKKANRSTDGDNEQFLNEMAILTQINHRHIVRLLGCCLELEVPLLVYEYVSNGNVAENLESKGPAGVMGWEQRLNVAKQTAEALAYLHAAASPPILHRDVKSANVLLDDNLDAKVADFGVSRLVPDGDLHVSTAVQGTLGYLDPEYFQTLQLTDKSDVYSLGVMLVELVTGLKPVDNHQREPRFANLALLFIERMGEGKGEEIIDPRLLYPSTQAATHSSIMAVNTLARRCLALRGLERPSMSHVADELRHIIQSLKGADEDDDETLPLLSSGRNYEAGAVVATYNAEYYVQLGSMSINNQLLNVPAMPR